MAQGPESPSSDGIHAEILQIIKPALEIGGVAGFSGLVFGGFAGVIRSNIPTLFAIASGIQWFTLGSTFTATRGIVLQAWGNEKLTQKDKVSASSIAGGISGGLGGMLRGRGNVIPGAIVFALFGAAGQAIYNAADAKHMEEALNPSKKKTSWMSSKWSPVKVLSDQEYEVMLEEKLLRVNAEIALVDESIERLRVENERQKCEQMQNQKAGETPK